LSATAFWAAKKPLHQAVKAKWKEIHFSFFI
jgi:hypothetical protein